MTEKKGKSPKSAQPVPAPTPAPSETAAPSKEAPPDPDRGTPQARYAMDGVGE